MRLFQPELVPQFCYDNAFFGRDVDAALRAIFLVDLVAFVDFLSFEVRAPLEDFFSSLPGQLVFGQIVHGPREEVSVTISVSQ